MAFQAGYSLEAQEWRRQTPRCFAHGYQHIGVDFHGRAGAATPLSIIAATSEARTFSTGSRYTPLCVPHASRSSRPGLPYRAMPLGHQILVPCPKCRESEAHACRPFPQSWGQRRSKSRFTTMAIAWRNAFARDGSAVGCRGKLYTPPRFPICTALSPAPVPAHTTSTAGGIGGSRDPNFPRL